MFIASYSGWQVNFVTQDKIVPKSPVIGDNLTHNAAISKEPRAFKRPHS